MGIICEECKTHFKIEKNIHYEYDNYDTNEHYVLFMCPRCLSTFKALKDDDGYYGIERYFFG